MKNKTSSFIAMCLAVVLVFALFGMAGCAKGGAKEGKLLVRYVECGYGDVWLKTAAKKFEETHEGIKVKLEGDPSLGSSNVYSQLQSGKNLADVYMLLNAPWREWVSLGYLANLNSVYETEVQTSAGATKIKDFMLNDVCDSYYMPRYVGQEQSFPWAMPWALIQVGICYNQEMLAATPRRAQAGNWTTPPETVEELVEYCGDLTARGITPFAFAGSEPHWLQYLMRGWWGQYQGAYTPNTANPDVNDAAGSYFDFWNYKSADVFNQAGIKASVAAFQSIFCKINADGDLKNVSENVMVFSTQDAEKEFALQKCAMLIGGSFMENEVGDWRDMDNDGKNDFTIRMMTLPRINGAQCGTNGDPLQMNYYNSEDLMFVPAKAVNLDLAKEFLAFLSSEEAILDFTKQSGSIRPFKYNAAENEKDGFEYTPFTKDVINIYNTSDVRLMAYPVGTPQESVSPIYMFLTPTPESVHSGYFSAIRRQSAENILKEIHQNAQREWNKWLQEVA